jgi:hypothetical protein
VSTRVRDAGSEGEIEAASGVRVAISAAMSTTVADADPHSPRALACSHLASAEASLPIAARRTVELRIASIVADPAAPPDEFRSSSRR